MSDFKGIQLDFAVLLQTLQRINPYFPHLHLGWGGIYIYTHDLHISYIYIYHIIIYIYIIYIRIYHIYIYDTIMPKHSVPVDIVKVNKLFIKGLRISYTV